MKMKATKRFPYAGRNLEIGDVFDASESDARVFQLVEQAVPAPLGLPKKQNYKTRDMKAKV